MQKNCLKQWKENILIINEVWVCVFSTVIIRLKCMINALQNVENVWGHSNMSGTNYSKLLYKYYSFNKISVH